MHTIRIINEFGWTFERKIPSSWAELSAKQVLFIAPRLMAMRPDIANVKDEILTMLFKMRKKHLRRLNIGQMNGYHKALNFMFEKIELQQNPLPRVRRKLIRYRGPKEKLKDLRFGQFVIADTYYVRYLKHRQQEDLDMLIASLYKSRKKFDASVVEKVARRMAGMSQEKKLAILMFYTGCRKYINGRFPLLFPKTESKEKKKKSGGGSWASVLVNLVGDSPAEKDRVENLDLYFALSYLESQVKQTNELKEKIGKGR